MANTKVEIVRSEQVDWKQYKRIRLEMLQMEPEAFNTKLEDEADRSQSYWEGKLADKNNMFAFAKIGNDIVGVMNLTFRERGEPNDVAVIHGAYVNSDFRGLGIGRQLLDYLIDRAKKVSGVNILKLWVKEYQRSAVNLYLRTGFQIVSKVDEHTFIMQKQL